MAGQDKEGRPHAGLWDPSITLEQEAVGDECEKPDRLMGILPEHSKMTGVEESEQLLEDIIQDENNDLSVPMTQ